MKSVGDLIAEHNARQAEEYRDIDMDNDELFIDIDKVEEALGRTLTGEEWETITVALGKAERG